MDRFFIPSIAGDAATFCIDSVDELHHMTHVLRLQPGERGEFADGRGSLVVGEILSISRSRAEVRVVSRKKAEAESSPRIILACAIPKKVKFEDIIDQCTQLGVHEVVPLLTERTEVVWRDKDLAAKCSRLEKVAVAAFKQSKRLWMPIVAKPCQFVDALHRISADTCSFIPWLEGERQVLQTLLPASVGKKELLFFIGPEGDFSPTEVQLAQSFGVVPVSLGPNVLRVDTAAAFVVGMARFLCSDGAK